MHGLLHVLFEAWKPVHYSRMEKSNKADPQFLLMKEESHTDLEQHKQIIFIFSLTIPLIDWKQNLPMHEY